jgi:hypothetical protein
MANRVLLLLAMASRNDPNASPKILSETTGQFIFVAESGIDSILHNKSCNYLSAISISY